MSGFFGDSFPGKPRRMPEYSFVLGLPLKMTAAGSGFSLRSGSFGATSEGKLSAWSPTGPVIVGSLSCLSMSLRSLSSTLLKITGYDVTLVVIAKPVGYLSIAAEMLRSPLSSAARWLF